ncbi:MAG: carbon starvation CstA family protein [Planctomycetota bacterium]
MDALLMVAVAAACLVTAYFTYGRWLAHRVFQLDDANPTPAHTHADNRDFIASAKSVVFGHHFTSIAGTGPIVGPAIAVLWGWLPALLWVLIGSIFIGAVHDLGSLVVSLRNKGRTIGDVAGEILGPRARTLFLAILVLALWIVLAVFGLVIAAVVRAYPAAITPVLVQIPLAIAVGLLLHRVGRSIVVASVISAALLLGTTWFSAVAGDIAASGSAFAGLAGFIDGLNGALAAQPPAVWILGLLGYAYIASVLPVWLLLQPRDYVNALQLLVCLGLLVAGLVAAATLGGQPLAGASGERPELSIIAPAVRWQPIGAPPILPVLFITVACGACSGFHCLVSSGTTSKQLSRERDAKPIGYGAMLTEGFLATLVIAACVAGVGLGGMLTPTMDTLSRVTLLNPDAEDPQADSPTVAARFTRFILPGEGRQHFIGIVEPAPDLYQGDELTPWIRHWTFQDNFDVEINLGTAELVESTRGEVNAVTLDDGIAVARANPASLTVSGPVAYDSRYRNWQSAGSLEAKVGAFVHGAGNFVAALGVPLPIAIALMAVFVASFAATTMDTSARLQRYVLQELGRSWLPRRQPLECPQCGYDCAGTRVDDAAAQQCPECGTGFDPATNTGPVDPKLSRGRIPWWNPAPAIVSTHGATAVAVLSAAALAIAPAGLLGGTSMSPGTGGLVLWPVFGATNQLLAGFAFVVIVAWLVTTRRPWWFAVVPAIVMLVVPAWAMLWQAFIGDAQNRSWLVEGQFVLIGIAIAVIVLEIWLIVEALKRVPALRRLRR